MVAKLTMPPNYFFGEQYSDRFILAFAVQCNKHFDVTIYFYF